MLFLVARLPVKEQVQFGQRRSAGPTRRGRRRGRLVGRQRRRWRLPGRAPLHGRRRPGRPFFGEQYFLMRPQRRDNIRQVLFVVLTTPPTLPGDMIPKEVLESRILLIRDKRVMVDWDLAILYEVETRRLNEQVKRNLKRFPPDFMFRLTPSERAELVAKCDRFARMKHSSSMPYAFTDISTAPAPSAAK